VSGPFETEREARAAALEAGGPPCPGWVILSAEQNRRMLTRACEAAGVTLGAYDARILAWFAGFEDAACAVIAGLISRASVPLAPGQLSTVLAALHEAAEAKRDNAAMCADCEDRSCGTCEWRERVAVEYGKLAETLRGQP
jgi:hypothetical protein